MVISREEQNSENGTRTNRYHVSSRRPKPEEFGNVPKMPNNYGVPKDIYDWRLAYEEIFRKQREIYGIYVETLTDAVAMYAKYRKEFSQWHKYRLQNLANGMWKFEQGYWRSNIEYLGWALCFMDNLMDEMDQFISSCDLFLSWYKATELELYILVHGMGNDMKDIANDLFISFRQTIGIAPPKYNEAEL